MILKNYWQPLNNLEKSYSGSVTLEKTMSFALMTLCFDIQSKTYQYKIKQSLMNKSYLFI